MPNEIKINSYTLKGIDPKIIAAKEIYVEEIYLAKNSEADGLSFIVNKPQNNNSNSIRIESLIIIFFIVIYYKKSK